MHVAESMEKVQIGKYEKASQNPEREQILPFTISIQQSFCLID
jgi:hypothetical protein